MPGFDGTGPRGQGPRSGRGLGDCQTENRGSRRGQGRQLPNMSEIEALQEKIDNLEQELISIKKLIIKTK